MPRIQPHRPNRQPANNGLNCPLFVLDVSFMKDLIEGRNLNNRVFLEIVRRKQLNLPMKVVTTTSAFNRAIFLCMHTSSIQNVKLLMSFIDTFYQSSANYKDGVLVDRDIRKFTDIISRGEL